MEEQTTALIPNTLKPTLEVESLVQEEGRDYEFMPFYAERKDAEKVLYRSRVTDKEQFVDHGSLIQIIATDPAEQAHSIKAAMELAVDRGWREIEVTGDEAFRRQVWLESSLAGIQVRGYTPSPEDKAELEKLRPGSAPAPAEAEPSIITTTVGQSAQVTLTDDQERFRSTLFPKLSPVEYLAMEKKMQAEYQALPQDAQERISATVDRIEQQADPMLAHEMRVGSQHDVADAREKLKETLSRADTKARADHELFSTLGSLKERHDASSQRPEPGRGNELAADPSRHTTNGPGR